MKINSINKLIIFSLIGFFIINIFTVSISAEEENTEIPEKCTAIYVGKKVSKEGTMIIARSNDQLCGINGRLFTVIERQSGTNRKIVDTGDGQNNFSVDIPDFTYKYTTLLDASGINNGPYYATCVNEWGVAVTATVTTQVSREYSYIDPVKKSGEGIRESIIAAIPACQSKNARQAVSVMANYIDKYGSCEYSTILISDINEAWIFEIYGGYSYCAMRLPDDKVCVFGNQVMIGYVDFKDTTNYVFSDNLKGNLDRTSTRYVRNGLYHIAKTVSGGVRYMHANMRNWIGQYRLAPSRTSRYYTSNYFYDLAFAPDDLVSVLDVMKLFGDRFEGTIYENSIDSNVRPIGVTRQSDVSIIQTFSELPLETCQVSWLCMGNAEHCVFVPSFSGILETFEKYHIDNKNQVSINDSFYYKARANASIAESDRRFLSKGLKDFNYSQESRMLFQVLKSVDKINELYLVSKEECFSYVTKLSNSFALKQYNNLSDIYNQMMYVNIYNSNDKNYDKKTFVYIENPKSNESAYKDIFKEKINIIEKEEDIEKYKYSFKEFAFFSIIVSSPLILLIIVAFVLIRK